MEIFLAFFEVEQVMRIELTTTAWEAVVLPLNYTCVNIVYCDENLPFLPQRFLRLSRLRQERAPCARTELTATVYKARRFTAKLHLRKYRLL